LKARGRDFEPKEVGARGDDGKLTLASNAEVKKKMDLPQAGEYTLRIMASGDQAGDELPKLGVKLGDRELQILR
jgi:hypothetical protein